MMKFIHLTDPHLVGGGGLLHGIDPAQRLRRAVDSMNADHGDAEQVIITGDLTNWGDEAAYAAFFAEIERLQVPYATMIGNHDDRATFYAARPDLPRDDNGFAQQVLTTSIGPFILTDTKTPDGHHGRYCAQRLAWLDQQLTAIDTPVLFSCTTRPLRLAFVESMILTCAMMKPSLPFSTSIGQRCATSFSGIFTAPYREAGADSPSQSCAASSRLCALMSRGNLIRHKATSTFRPMGSRR